MKLIGAEQTQRALGKTKLNLKGYKTGEEGERKQNPKNQRQGTVNNLP
jgi:hypothetical protein